MNDRNYKKGIPIRAINYVLLGVTVVVAVLLLLTTFLARRKGNELRAVTEDYIDWNSNAMKMTEASDYLTEQVRLFVKNGNRENLDNYFTEAEETRRRDEALAAIGEKLPDTDAFSELKQAMDESVRLMETEYRAMKLAVTARGGSLADYPEKVQNAGLTDEDLDAGNALERAAEIVFDKDYLESKETIYNRTHRSLNALSGILKTRFQQSFDSFDRVRFWQMTLTVTLIAVILISLVLISVIVIRPVVKASRFVRDEKPLPFKPASMEYRTIARMYNKMVEVNNDRRKQLTYDANHDKLTGLLNRGGFERVLATIDTETCAFMMIDIDGFKQINDSYGRDVGDRVLVAVADELRENFRSGDYLCRLGDDEFTVILTCVNKMHWHFRDKITDKIRNINAALCAPRDDLPQVTISAAVSMVNNDTDMLLRVANNALYEAKKTHKGECQFID